MSTKYVLLLLSVVTAFAQLRPGEPGSVGMSADRLQRAADILAREVGRAAFQRHRL